MLFWDALDQGGRLAACVISSGEMVGEELITIRSSM
jgi:hypothetical protein